MDIETAIRARRTHKAFRADPVEQELLERLFELARWAPNHHLTEPWRFRVVGPETLERLKEAAGPEAAPKLDRAPTLVVCSALLSGEPETDEEDLHATACATYIVLLGAVSLGLSCYWRTPGFMREQAGRIAVGLAPEERFVGLIYLGEGVGESTAPERSPVSRVTSFLP